MTRIQTQVVVSKTQLSLSSLENLYLSENTTKLILSSNHRLCHCYTSLRAKAIFCHLFVALPKNLSLLLFPIITLPLFCSYLKAGLQVFCFNVSLPIAHMETVMS